MSSRPVPLSSICGSWLQGGLSLAVKLPQHPSTIRNWSVTAELFKEEDYMFDPSVKRVTMGVGWESQADIDASAILLDSELTPVETVWFRSLQSSCKSVKHSGDKTAGVGGGGDEEMITIDLESLPAHIHHIALVVSMYTFDLFFSDLGSGYVRIAHGHPKHHHHLLCYCRLTELSGSSLLLGQLTRKGGYWNFRALATPMIGKTAMHVLRVPGNLAPLASCISAASSYRRIIVEVEQGRNLAAKNATGWLRRTASSDHPYYIISYRKKRLVSDHQIKTVNPIWNRNPFDMGIVIETETKALKIAIFDRDFCSHDHFMGMVRIPATVLFHLGPGTHGLRLELGPSTKDQYQNQEVKGEICISVTIVQVSTDDISQSTFV